MFLKISFHIGRIRIRIRNPGLHCINYAYLSVVLVWACTRRVYRGLLHRALYWCREIPNGVIIPPLTPNLRGYLSSVAREGTEPGEIEIADTVTALPSAAASASASATTSPSASGTSPNLTQNENETNDASNNAVRWWGRAQHRTAAGILRLQTSRWAGSSSSPPGVFSSRFWDSCMPVPELPGDQPLPDGYGEQCKNFPPPHSSHRAVGGTSQSRNALLLWLQHKLSPNLMLVPLKIGFCSADYKY